MRTLVSLHLLSLIGLPPAIWFALDARITRLNPWIWTLLGFLAMTAPSFAIFWFIGFVRGEWLTGLLSERTWNVLIVSTALAGGWFTAFMIHKWVLKPKRVATIGNSLNYVGGWLGTLIFMLFYSALSLLAIYAGNTYKTLEQLCPGEQTGASLFRCAIVSTPGAWETLLMILGVVGLSWAAIALGRKRPSAIRITGCLLLCFFVLGFSQFLDVDTADDARSLSIKEERRNLVSVEWLGNAVWVAYLIRSRRVREVYGRNLGRRNESSASGVPT